MNKSILILEDQKNQRERLYNLFTDEGYNTFSASSVKDAEKLIKSKKFDLALLDLKLPDGSGIDVLKTIKKKSPKTQVIILTAYGTIKTAINAIKIGAYDFITKPVEIDELLSLVQKASEFGEKSEIEITNDNCIDTGNMVWQSDEMNKIIDEIKLVASGDANVLIQGESGTGKELVARAIHNNSLRRNEPFVTVNCAAFQESLLESELFGHVKGAFTGAQTNKTGLVEIAKNGTLFLDEVGELSPSIQAKLLRFSEYGEFRSVGGLESKRVNIRIISATNKDIEHSNFRKDLYYRLNVFNIILPPLRKRKSDICVIAEHFINNHKTFYKKKLSEKAKIKLNNYDYPGNIRELQNIIEQALIISKNTIIEPSDIRIKDSTSKNSKIESIGTLKKITEKELIVSILEKNNGNRELTAKDLNISVRTLYRKIKKYNI